MNFLVDNFYQITNFAKTYGLPFFKKRAILREYLQAKTLEIIYGQKESVDLIFVGGTSLRQLRSIDRFSEDLDFDIGGQIKFITIDKILDQVIKRFKKENIKVELYKNKKLNKTYYELKFPEILSDLRLTKNKEEKLIIKLDFERYWMHHKKETIFFNRYGFLINMVTASMDNLLVEKLTAYLKRKQTQPRDLYDITWLISHQAKYDKQFADKNKLGDTMIEQVLKKYEREKSKLSSYKRRLKPFLFDENNVNKLDFFKEIIS